jgi:hypothetical protein
MILLPWEYIRTRHEMLWWTIDWQLVITRSKLNIDWITQDMWSYKCSEIEKQNFLWTSITDISIFEQAMQDYIIANF